MGGDREATSTVIALIIPETHKRGYDECHRVTRGLSEETMIPMDKESCYQLPLNSINLPLNAELAMVNS